MPDPFNHYFIGLIFVYLCGYKSIIVIGEVFTLGYLTGSQRRSGNLEYAKPGKYIYVYRTNESVYFFFDQFHYAIG